MQHIRVSYQMAYTTPPMRGGNEVALSGRCKGSGWQQMGMWQPGQRVNLCLDQTAQQKPAAKKTGASWAAGAGATRCVVWWCFGCATGVSVAGELVLGKINSERTQALASVETSYADALSKAALLRKAVMNYDFATAPAVLQQSNAAEVLALAEMPAAWPSTADQPSKLALDPALYNYKDQGVTTMDTSYAAIAALEGAIDAAKNSERVRSLCMHFKLTGRAHSGIQTVRVDDGISAGRTLTGTATCQQSAVHGSH